jgi:hypothetical protein
MLGGTSAGALTLGSSAFSSATTEREVNVDVVPDAEAMVGYEIRKDVEADKSESQFPELTVTAGKGKERTLVTVLNRFGEGTTLEISDVEVMTQDDEGPAIADVEWDEAPFRSTADIRGRIVCTEAGSNMVELTVTVEGTGVAATLSGDKDTRRFVIRCEPESLPDLTSEFLPSGSGKVVFNGLGQIELKHEDQGMVDVKFYVGNKTGANKQMSINSSSVEKVKTNQKVGGDRFSSRSVVGVQIGDSNSIYLHPSWNRHDCMFEKGSGGTVSDPTEDTDPTKCGLQ